MLEEESEINSYSLNTYYKDPNYEIDVAEILRKKLICKSLVKRNLSIESYKANGSFKKFTFDIYKEDEILDHLLEGKVLKLSHRVNLPYP